MRKRASLSIGDCQKIRMHASGDEVPSGAMSRSIDVILRNEMVERGKAGDKVVITGMPIMIPDFGQLFGVNAESRRGIFGREGGLCLSI
jgi:DNA replication licensing factor MCM6